MTWLRFRDEIPVAVSDFEFKNNKDEGIFADLLAHPAVCLIHSRTRVLWISWMNFIAAQAFNLRWNFWGCDLRDIGLLAYIHIGVVFEHLA